MNSEAIIEVAVKAFVDAIVEMATDSEALEVLRAYIPTLPAEQREQFEVSCMTLAKMVAK